MNALPPFKNGIRAVKYYSVAALPSWRIGARRGPLDQVEVDYTGSLYSSDIEGPLAVLNDAIKGWPMHPVTADQVREYVNSLSVDDYPWMVAA